MLVFDVVGECGGCDFVVFVDFLFHGFSLYTCSIALAVWSVILFWMYSIHVSVVGVFVVVGVWFFIFSWFMFILVHFFLGFSGDKGGFLYGCVEWLGFHSWVFLW